MILVAAPFHFVLTRSASEELTVQQALVGRLGRLGMSKLVRNVPLTTHEKMSPFTGLVV
jgi:hypothetical protein